MKAIIIPDVHLKIHRLDFIFEKFKGKFDKAIFLGDFFDDWNDSSVEAEATAEWVKKRLQEHPEDVFILSNHDQAYRFPNNPHMRCSGFEGGKSKAINRVLTQEDWERFKLVHFENGYWMSHAGLSPHIFGHPTEGITEEIINKQCEEALTKAKSNQYTVYLGAGRARGGPQPYGGCTWLDFDYEFEAIPGVDQIVGHTPHKEPQIKSGDNSLNYGLDTHLNHVGFLEDWLEVVAVDYFKDLVDDVKKELDK